MRVRFLAIFALGLRGGLLSTGTAADQASPAPASPIAAELHRLLLADATAAATNHRAAAPKGNSGPADTARTPGGVEPPRETPVDRFFRTGILASRTGPEFTRKWTVGSCEGGQLLNLRWLH